MANFSDLFENSPKDSRLYVLKTLIY